MSDDNTCFVYFSYIDEKETDITSIRLYGIDKNDKNICLRIDDFTPYIYLELPLKNSNGSTINWESKVQILANKIDDLIDKPPLKKKLQYKYKLYGSNLDEKYNKKLFPYLLCSFSNKNDYRKFMFMIRKPLFIQGIGQISLKMHEQDASEILQLFSCRDIPTAGWITFKGNKIKDSEKLTLCDREYFVSYKHLNKTNINSIVKPKIMAFDIEVNSSNPSAMPNCIKPDDKVFQISCVFFREGVKNEYDIYLLTLGEINSKKLGEHININMYETEADLLEGFTALIRSENPNVITGYNILKFDIEYMINRAESSNTFFCIGEFDKMGFHIENHSNKEVIKWSSSAFKNQEFKYLNAEGRIIVDLLPIIQRDYKLNNYKLSTVSQTFIGDNKDDLSPKGIFKCYRLGTTKEPDGTYGEVAVNAMTKCGKYCIQDSVLVVKLMEKLDIWTGISEMAKTTNISIFDTFTQGQQKKVYSQIYKFCMYQNIVVEKDAYETKDNERYVGAHVFPPVPGIYERVLPFDFASLYPTTLIAYNIDYHTWVTDPAIPDSMCNVMNFEDHIGCEHDPKVIEYNKLSKYIEDERIILKKLRDDRDDKKNKSIKDELVKKVNEQTEKMKPFIKKRSEIKKTISKTPMCAKRYYRFLKEPKGVVPTILQNLLDARKNTRKEIKNNKLLIEGLTDPEKINELKSLNNVLDKRQLAYKVCCNSVYGILGVRKGLLPFMPGAMCCTYMGRVNIEKVAEEITKKYKGQLVYGDTDSNYITFPHLKTKTAQETWDYAEMVAEEVSKLFPRPITLEYESTIYSSFIILTKKRYMYKSMDRDGNIDHKIGKKGVLLARRDNALIIRNIYEKLIEMIFNKKARYDILYFLLQEINRICSDSVLHKEFVITKAVGDINNMMLVKFKDEKGKMKGQIGNYIVPLLPTNQKELEKQLRLKDAEDEKEYYKRCLPAVIQLSEKMRSRGQRVDVGSRLEYVITDIGYDGKQYEKIENIDYFMNHKDVLKINFFDYLKLMINPIDEALNVAFNRNIEGGYKFKKDFILEQYNFRVKVREKCMTELKSLFNPKLVFKNR